MAAVGQGRNGGRSRNPGGWKVASTEGVPARGPRRVWVRAVAGTRSAAGLAAASLPLVLVLVLPGGPAGATASGANAKTVKISTAKVAGVGTVLTSASGLTLYRFTEDKPGTSTCSGACAKIWPPLLAAKGGHVSGPHGVKGFSLVKLTNGHWQVAFHNLPLYTFEGDKKKGQAHGQNVGKVWFAVLKSGIPASNASPTAPTAAEPGTSTTQPPTPTTQVSGSSSTPAPAATPTTRAPAPPPTTTPPTQPKPPPTTTTTAAPITGGTGF